MSYFARSVPESIFLLFFRTDPHLATSSLGLYENLRNRNHYIYLLKMVINKVIIKNFRTRLIKTLIFKE